MEPEVNMITREIVEKGKGYAVVRRCAPAQLHGVVQRAAATLRSAGARQIFLASTDPQAPLSSGAGLRHHSDMLELYRDLSNLPRQRASGRLTLESMNKESMEAWLVLYHQIFFDVPNSATYGSEEQKRLMGTTCRCGFVQMDGKPVGIYELSFERKDPEIAAIGLRKEVRGCGLGRDSLLVILEDLVEMGHKHCWLRVSTANPAAYNLYENVGFALNRTCSHWYEMEPAWADMERPIPSEEDPDLTPVPAPVDCGEELIDVTELHPRVAFDASYRKRGLRGAMERCWMRRGVWERLKGVADGLPKGYSLLIYDCLRPLPLQKAIYEEFSTIVRERQPGITQEEVESILNDFVAKPVKRLARPAPHTTGGAVDLTLCRDGIPLDMGTDFDDLSPMAHTAWLEEHPESVSEEARRNRRLLFHRMKAAGFINYCTEWWHYAYGERMWAYTHSTTPIYGFCPVCDFPETDCL